MTLCDSCEEVPAVIYFRWSARLIEWSKNHLKGEPRNSRLGLLDSECEGMCKRCYDDLNVIEIILITEEEYLASQVVDS